MKVSKFYVGWATGFMTAVVPVVLGFTGKTLEQIGWLESIATILGSFLFFFLMERVAEWALGKEE